MHGFLVACTPTLVIDPEAPGAFTAVGPGDRTRPTRPTVAPTAGGCSSARSTPKFQRNAFEVLGISDLLTDPKDTGGGPRLFAPENRSWVRARIAEAFGQRPRDEWLQLLSSCDCPAGPVEERERWLDHPQLVALGERCEFVDPPPWGGRHPWGACGVPPHPARPPAPRRFVTLAELPRWDPPAQVGFDGERGRGGGPLEGIRVSILGRSSPGLTWGLLPAGAGAEVVKVEPPTADGFQVTRFQYNRGQRSLAVDLRTPRGSTSFSHWPPAPTS